MTINNLELSHSGPGGNPHDYFGRKTIGDPLIAADLLRNYPDLEIAEYVDLDHLQAEPTQFFGPAHPITGVKEVILDVPYIAHLRDADWKSEVLMVLEHKSSPNLYVLLQLAVQAILSLYKRWTDAGRPSSRQKFKVPIPLMVLVYCGADDLDETILWFQSLFEFIPKPLRQFVPQFRLIVINLRKFDYDHLPGRPETQAVVETMKRAFDGTLAEHFPDVLGRLSTIPIDDRIIELIGSIAWYSDRVTDIEPERVFQSITDIIKGKEGIDMAEVVKKGFFQEVYENGVIEGMNKGITRGKINSILKLLELRFKRVPNAIVEELNSRTDLIALESLFELAAQCDSIEEFMDIL